MKANWDSIATIVMQGESLPYEDQFMDRDPTYTAADGKPLLRLTFDWHDNDYAMHKFIASKADEIMKAMGLAEMLRLPSWILITSINIKARTLPAEPSWALSLGTRSRTNAGRSGIPPMCF